MRRFLYFTFFFFNDTATTEIYTLSLHDALPISSAGRPGGTMFGKFRRNRKPNTRPGILVVSAPKTASTFAYHVLRRILDRKSTRLNSSHQIISYAVFCLKKKKRKQI